MTDTRSALITGVTGQDGSYLAELLLEKGYDVHGMVRRASTEKFDRIEHLRDRITLHQGDLLDQRSLVDALRAAQPSEIYNLAAMSFVAVSWIQPTLTAEFTGVGVTRMLEAMREVCPEARFYQASSSEMFGKVLRGAADRDDAVLPALALRRRQGLRPLHHRQLPRVLRPARDLGDPFQPRVARAAGWSSSRARSPGTRPRSSTGCAKELRLGNLDAERDWGYAKDYVEAMWLMLQRDTPEDYVIATGKAHSVRECCEIAFDEAGLGDFEQYVTIDPAFVRPAEVDHLIGDPAKAERDLGWKPQTSFEELIRLMTRADLELLEAALSTDGRAAVRHLAHRCSRCARSCATRSSGCSSPSATSSDPRSARSSASSPPTAARRTAWAWRTGPTRSRSRCARWASARAMRWSCRRSRSTPPPRRSRRPARGRCSATSIPTPTA